MARNSSRPGRTVLVFFAALAAAFGLVAVIGTWKPALGLDLQGGTQIILTAKDSNVKSDQLKEAANIIDARVNGSGVSEATVNTQGSRRDRRPGARPHQQQPRADRGPAGPALLPTRGPGAPDRHAVRAAAVDEPLAEQRQEPPARGVRQAGPAPRRRRPRARRQARPRAAAPASSPTASPGVGDAPTSTSEVQYTPANKKAIADPLTWMKNPDPQSVAVYNAFTCPAQTPVVDDPTLPLVTCSDKPDEQTGQYVKYLLSPALIRGTQITSASAGIPQQQVQWVVNLQLDSKGSAEQLKLSQAMAGTQDQFAIVLDGQVISAPVFQGVIANGSSQISGNFTESSAKSLATSLKYGALPIQFDQSKTTIQVIGPSLAGDQLKAGITAGILGLLLVMAYCLLYYRGLGTVVVASLIVAGAHDVRAGAAAGQERRLHADPARHRRSDRRGRHHRRLVHRLLRTHP